VDNFVKERSKISDYSLIYHEMNSRYMVIHTTQTIFKKWLIDNQLLGDHVEGLYAWKKRGGYPRKKELLDQLK